MATTLLTVDFKLFQMIPYMIILKVGKFHQRSARRKPEGGHIVPPPSLNRDKYAIWLDFRTIDDNKLHGSGR